MSLSVFLLLALFLLNTVYIPAQAQFQWQIDSGASSTSLATCVSLPITVKPFDATLSNSSGVPPYYIMAFAIGGTPTTTLIGTDNKTLSWTVTQPVGTRLILSVVDAVGSEGGIPSQIFNVTAGQTTDCVTTPPTTSEFTVTSNVTGSLATCQPWGLSINGGVAPYNITLASLDARVVTNVTLPSGDNRFTYINRAAPGAQLLAAVSDSTGRWATGTPMLATQGSSSTDCNGLSSSSDHTTTSLHSTTSPSLQSTTSLSKQQTGSATANAQGKNKTPIIVGVTVPLAIIVLVLAVFLYLRKRREQQVEKEDPLKPRQFHVEEESERQAINQMSSADTPPSGGKRLAALVTSRYPHPPATASNATSSGPTKRGDTSSIPSATGMSSSSLVGPSQTRPTQTPNSADEGVGLEEGITVFQHRDAAAVREVPPPYADSQSRPDS